MRRIPALDALLYQSWPSLGWTLADAVNNRVPCVRFDPDAQIQWPGVKCGPWVVVDEEAYERLVDAAMTLDALGRLGGATTLDHLRLRKYSGEGGL